MPQLHLAEDLAVPLEIVTDWPSAGQKHLACPTPISETRDVDRSADDLEAGLDEVQGSPRDRGRLVLIVRRPAVDERELLDVGILDLEVGLVGDTWHVRGSRLTEDGSSDPAKQLNVMNARAAALIAGAKSRWALAGDQLYIDFDLSEDNLPPGTQLAIGSAVIEITNQPHLGCAKFAARFGRDALRFVNSKIGVALRLRGVNARIIQPGIVRTGDTVHKVEPDT
jgi:hypothetical protein